MPRFTFGAIERIERELDGVNFRDLATFVDDSEKLLKVIGIAFKAGGVAEAEAEERARNITRGEFIDRYAEDMGISAVKKLAMPANTS